MYDGYLSPIRCFASVGRYYQGPNAIALLPDIIKKEGTVAFILIDAFFYDDYKVSLKEKLEKEGIDCACFKAEMQITDAAIDRLKQEALSLSRAPDVYVGIGGGKTCDAIKCMGDIFKKPVIELPTALATDAPPTSHSMVYREDGSSYMYPHLRSPEYVLVDTAITVNAPAIMFSSRLGDALATYFESVAINAFGHPTLAGRANFRRTCTGMMIARLCYDILMNSGLEAYESAKAHRVSQAYEDVAEALTLLSGLGVENTGCSVAHGLEKYIHIIAKRPVLHGQGVGYGTLVQMLLEQRDKEEFMRVYKWCKAVDLPVCMADFNVLQNAGEAIETLAQASIKDYLINREPFEVTAEKLIAAMTELEQYAS